MDCVIWLQRNLEVLACVHIFLGYNLLHKFVDKVFNNPYLKATRGTLPWRSTAREQNVLTTAKICGRRGHVDR